MTVLWVALALVVGIFLGWAVGYAIVSVRWYNLDAKKQDDLALLEEKRRQDLAEVARLKTWAEESVRVAKDWANAEVARSRSIMTAEVTSAKDWAAAEVTKAQQEAQTRAERWLASERQKLAIAQQEAKNGLAEVKRHLDKERTEIEATKRRVPELQQAIAALEAEQSRLQSDTTELHGQLRILRGEYQSKQEQYEASEKTMQEARDFESRRFELEVDLNHLSLRRTQLESEAESIVAQAQQKADETLANIKPEAERLTALAKAMQNKIDGYGMEYMVPGVGLLDELADDFGHSEAGQALKEARKKVRDMFKNGQAAQCDYVETNRRDTAIAFVADAFNGKVEEILSRVKHNNFGKLSQEIHDAVTLVNQNGAAFRNARITPEYVESRLDELKWATVVHELKVREREEQRAIQEQMREEAKVQKEIEKARKEAEKLAREQEREQREREALQKALDEARARGELEDKLRAMERQLADKDAVIATKQQQIDDNQRAISMAQQTKAGHVYVISNVGSFGEDVFKIGMTRRLEPLDRVNELGDASVPFPFDVHAMIKSDNAPDLERKLHGVFVLNQMNKTNVRKEFFRASAEEIKTAVEKLGGIAHWTMLAEAAQWRETLRIEQQIATDATYRQQWEERQVRLEETADDVADEAA